MTRCQHQQPHGHRTWVSDDLDILSPSTVKVSHAARMRQPRGDGIEDADFEELCSPSHPVHERRTSGPTGLVSAQARRRQKLKNEPIESWPSSLSSWRSFPAARFTEALKRMPECRPLPRATTATTLAMGAMIIGICGLALSAMIHLPSQPALSAGSAGPGQTKIAPQVTNQVTTPITTQVSTAQTARTVAQDADRSGNPANPLSRTTVIRIQKGSAPQPETFMINRVAARKTGQAASNAPVIDKPAIDRTTTGSITQVYTKR